jgi:IS5 family transposase
MRWRGLQKAALQVRFTAMAYNMKRTLNILKNTTA